MLKKSQYTQVKRVTQEKIDDLQRRYNQLKTEQRLNQVDIYDANHGGGFNALCQAEAEREDIEATLEAVECFLLEDDVELMEDILSAAAQSPEIRAKLHRYLQIVLPYDETATDLPIVGE